MADQTTFLGGSRGFGAEVLRQTLALGVPANLLCRRPQNFSGEVGSQSFDFTKVQDQERLFKYLSETKPQRLFYFAGGGPFGDFEEQKLTSHLWAMELNLIFPLKLLHWSLRQKFLKQIIFIGSAIAESQADPRASSYSSAKHGLLGLLSSVVFEEKALDIRLFSPGYMDTQMIPANASVRSEPGQVLELRPLAAAFMQWAENPTGPWHLEVKDQSHLLNLTSCVE